MGHTFRSGFYEEIMPAHHRADCAATSISDPVASSQDGVQWS
jgi:hypothetical protein